MKKTNTDDYLGDLDTVYCSVDLNLIGNNTLFQRELIHKIITKDIAKFFTENGINYQLNKLQGLGGGGGGFSYLYELIMAAWNKRDLIELVWSCLTIIKFLPRIIRSRITNSINKERPRIILLLGLKLDENRIINKPELDNLLKNRLINLKRIGNHLSTSLSTKYPLFLFDQDLQASIPSLSFQVRFSFNVENNSDFNTWRYFKIIEPMDILPNIDLTYSFNKYTISKFERHTDYLSGMWTSSAGKDSKILGLFPKLF